MKKFKHFKAKNKKRSIAMDYTKFLCHRKPERSFFIKSYQFPVCARCTGFYISLALYFIYTYYFHVDYTPYLLIYALLLLFPAFIDGFTQFIKFRESNNILRLSTGFLGGLGLGIIIKFIKFLFFIKIGG